ncbi:hypothetical protein F2Q70_00031605 [Brassica cretica]|uniref:Pentacotripeptide-repeat region of PRORP domain-containing protein n=1 Tax=Brassica cretica TaxID=69181 RepID=A0A8S9FVU5_BRACR|nr:hypothetical protein F2Q70_00031605 [Brassica cretica]KAF2553543.1 hypothetical protein F2Q68_00036044 [Brassica cretica]
MFSRLEPVQRSSVDPQAWFGRRPRLAAEVFDLLPDDQKGVAAYTALMDIYISAGSPEKAMKIFEEMREREIMPSVAGDVQCSLVWS